MDTYTISFFGHREIDHPVEVRQRLEDIIKDLLLKKEYIEFLIGRDGEFDILTASIIRQAIRDYGNGNAAMILVLPYMKADYRDNEQSYLAYYHEIEICSASAEAHPKSAIQIRNRNMIDRSNLVVCCIQHKSGGAYKTIQYAMKHEKNTINVGGIPL
jgi:hypothetical protein